MQLPDLHILNAGAWQSDRASGRTPPRVVAKFELERYRLGCGTSFVDQKPHALAPGSLIFVRPGQVRYSQLPFCSDFIYFEITQDTDAFCRLRSAIPTVQPARCAARTEWLFAQIAQLFSAPETHALRMHALLLELLDEMVPAGAPEPRPPVPHTAEVNRAIAQMHARLGEPLRIPQLAAELGYSAPHFNSFFRAVTGVSPGEYFGLIKIQEAKRLLLTTEYTTAEIAERLGFSSASYFCSVFRRRTGHSPGAFAQRSHRNEYEP